MLLVQRDWEDVNVRNMQKLLDRHQDSRFKGFEWDYWNRNLHSDLHTLNGHSDIVHSVAFSPNGNRIASGSADGMLKTFDTRPLENNP